MTFSNNFAKRKVLELLANEGVSPANSIQAAIDRGYVARIGETPKSISYSITPKGREYVAENK